VIPTSLELALLLVSLVAVLLLALNFKTLAVASHVNPLVIQVDEVGRSEALSYERRPLFGSNPRSWYFLTRLVVAHFSRVRATFSAPLRSRCSCANQRSSRPR
jgi:hypothetical protein